MVIRKMQTQTTMKYHFTPSRMVQKNKQTESNQYGEQLELSQESCLPAPHSYAHTHHLLPWEYAQEMDV